MKRMSRLFFTFIFLFIGSHAGAAQLWLEVNEDISVYGKPSLGRPAMQLQSGQSVPISKNLFGNGKFRRVIVDFKGKQRGGYILQNSIHKSSIVSQEEKWPEFDKDEGPKPAHESGIGLFGGWQKFSQGKGSISSDSGQEFEIDNVSGTAIGAGLFYDFPMDDTWNLRFHLKHRQFKIKGSASILVEGVATGTNDFDKEQTMVSLGFAGRAYTKGSSNLWYSVGADVGKILSSKLTLANQSPIESDAANIPMRLLLAFGLGYDFNLSRRFQIIPEVYLTSIVNDEPVSLLAEVQISLRIGL